MEQRIQERSGESLIERIRRAGVRVTGPRRAIARVLEEAEDHLDVEAITDRAQRIDPTIHRATVYRTLGLLKGLGLVDELDLLHIHGDRHYYEIRQKDSVHAHVVCTRCSKVLEVEGAVIEDFKERVSAQTGFDVHYMRFEIGGYCEACRTGAGRLPGQVPPAPPQQH